MHLIVKLITAAAAVGAAAPAAAQYAYPQTYPQPYPQPYPQTYPYQGQSYPGQNYPGQNYPGQQGYGGTVIDQVIGQLLGSRYNVTDRRAVGQCATAAMAQAQNQFGYGQGYQQGYGGYGQGFAAPAMRVTSITEVQRRQNGLRVRGLLDTGSAGYNNQYGQYGQQGYANQRYAAGDLSFRCDVDYRGVVTNVRINRNGNRRY